MTDPTTITSATAHPTLLAYAAAKLRSEQLFWEGEDDAWGDSLAINVSAWSDWDQSDCPIASAIREASEALDRLAHTDPRRPAAADRLIRAEAIGTCALYRLISIHLQEPTP